MKWNSLYLPVLLFLLFPPAAAQNKVIRGSVKDVQNEPLMAATVKLFRTGDSAFVQGVTTGNNGKFQLDGISSGSFFLVISAVSYKPYEGVHFIINESASGINLPVIILLPAENKTLREVVVTAKRPLIEQDIDKTIINVEAMTGSGTNNTFEILEKTPGVVVSENGDISLNGKSNVAILIEGRPTYLSGQDLAAYLKSLPAGVLDKLELMDNPPARFDASGGAVINIRLKKNKATGLTGNLNAGLSQGQKFRTNEFIHLNYNKKKLNLFGNTGYGRGANYGLVTNDRIHYDEKGIPVSEILLTTRNEFENNVVFSRLGFDYNLGPETVIGMQVNLQNIPRTESANFESRNIIGAIDSVKSGDSDAAVKWRNLGVNLNFQQKFNKNRELTADLNYLQYQSTGRQDFNNFETLSGSEATPAGSFRYNILADIHIYNLKADYTIPLKHKAGLETGLKSSFIENDNDSRYADPRDEISIPDYGKSNRFIYHENVNAAYFSARKSWRKLGLQAGLRIENTLLEGRQPEYQTAKTTRFSQNFTDLFPSLFLTYQPDSSGHNTWTASLSRRISRPGYQQFNPFMNFRDNYSYTSGNPALKPYYQTQYEVSFRHKQLLTLRAGFGHSEGIILNITEASGNILVSKPLNVASENIWNFSANFNTEPLRWWRINYNLQYLISHYRGKIGTENLNTGLGNGRVNLTNLFTINPLWSADFTANYTSRSFQEQTFNRPRCIISGGIQKKVLRNAGSIRLTVEDFLHTWKSRGRMVSIRQTDVYRTSEFDSRRIGIAFSYRFGNEKFSRKRKHTDNAAESESRRAG